ncbi:MAG TPA: Rieske 2Fe-2S domain-containing protein [Actinomycetota bacterium]|nr:Rieske 2Fe-2S domain-containing protein [Actinomycetota bacterium]
MQPVMRQTVLDAIERLDVLDTPAEPLQGLVNQLVPNESELKDLLSGTWLGHPLHPVLTDVVLGCWISAGILDVLGGKAGRTSADRLIALGILAAVPTAAAGLADWADLDGGTRRVGSVHAVGNVAALALYSASWVARKRGHRARGMGLSMLAAGAALGSGWLGGHLSFGKGVGVNQTAFERWPRRWTAVAVMEDLEDGKAIQATAGDTKVVVVRQDGSVHALLDRCSHRGCALSRGQVRGDALVCPCHGSTFRLEDGAVVKGPATAPQPAFDVRVQEGNVEIRAPQP